MNILIAAPETLGEVVCSSALVRCLKAQVPEATVHYWITPHLAAAVVHNPYIDQLHCLADDPGLLPLNAFQFIIDLQSSRQLRQWAKAEGIRYLSCNPSFLVSFLSEQFGLYKESGPALPGQYFEAVKQLGVYYDNKGLDYFLGAEDEVQSTDIPMAQSAGYVALVAGEHDYDKPVPLRLLQAFCQRIQYPVILVNSRGANTEATRLSKADPVKIYNACGKFALNETADLLRRSRLVLTPETGLMQVAVALNKPVVVWRSSVQTTPFFPPCYRGRRAQAEPPDYAGWLWPAATVPFLRNSKKDSGTLTKGEELWVQQGLKLVNSFLTGSKSRI